MLMFLPIIHSTAIASRSRPDDFRIEDASVAPNVNLFSMIYASTVCWTSLINKSIVSCKMVLPYAVWKVNGRPDCWNNFRQTRDTSKQKFSYTWPPPPSCFKPPFEGNSARLSCLHPTCPHSDTQHLVDPSYIYPLQSNVPSRIWNQASSFLGDASGTKPFIPIDTVFSPSSTFPPSSHSWQLHRFVKTRFQTWDSDHQLCQT